MKMLLLILLLLTALCLVYSQDYDLIVKFNGDSIACHIDSVTDTHIYFEMKSNNYWKHTHISKADVIEFKRNVINRKQVVFKNGTSIIKKIKEPVPQPTSIRDIQKNSVYVGVLSVNYSRMIPVGDRVGFTVVGGFNFAGGLQAETTLLIGGTKHFFEPGFMAIYVMEFYDSPLIFAMIRTGYRYQGPEGFLFRVAPLIGFEKDKFTFLPTITIGYSF